jgi:magnesium chelatase family protein
MYTNIKSHGLSGIEGFTVNIEVAIFTGLPAYNMVGLPDTAVRESRERVQSAIKNSRYTFPNDKVIINLAPADMRKEGTQYDLPIALGLLVASKQISDKNIGNFTILGELALDGTVRHINGILPMVIDASERGETNFLIPAANAKEAAQIEGVNIFAVNTLKEAAQFLDGKLNIEPMPIERWLPDDDCRSNDFSLIQGQFSAKRAVEVAVCRRA